MPIKGLTERRRMPRIGKMHLGIKVESTKKPGVFYPKATDYFVFPEDGSAGYELIDELIAEYGEKPKELAIIFPLEDEEAICSQYYRCYSRSRGLTCRGDGETCTRMIDTKTGDLVNKDSEETELKEMSCTGTECPDYARGSCREIMNLQFMLPKISGLGVWQIDTSSINSIRNINSCIELIRSVYGRIRMVPLFLSIEPMEVTPPNSKKKTVHVLNLRSMDNMIEAAIKARKPPLELIIGAVGVEEAQRRVDEAWGPEEKDRMLSSGEAEERMTPGEIEEAREEPELEVEKGEPEIIQEEAETLPDELTEAELEQTEEPVQPKLKPDEKKDERTAPVKLITQVKQLFYIELKKSKEEFGHLVNDEKKWGIKDLKNLKTWQANELIAIAKKELGKEVG